RYKTFGELNKHVLKPTVAEINAIAPFNVSVLPVKQGKRVAAIKVGWWPKDSEALHEAGKELERSKVGRRARLAGTVEYVFAPMPSTNRLTRQGGSFLDLDE
ncbi:MAG: replication initiation protein, partial [Candidatus Igneacidithiobacillus chanchocoensis]